jgi:hypothetical protein
LPLSVFEGVQFHRSYADHEVAFVIECLVSFCSKPFFIIKRLKQPDAVGTGPPVVYR